MPVHAAFKNMHEQLVMVDKEFWVEVGEKKPTATHTTRGTPTSAGLHTSVQVLSKENEIWLINNK